MSNKKKAKKFVLKSKPNVMLSIREMPHGESYWLSPEELGTKKESVSAMLDRVSRENPGEYAYWWDREEQCFFINRK